jgi:DnaJ homolog subfamily C member 2
MDSIMNGNGHGHINGNKSDKPIHLHLFDFSEDEIKHLNYYQILGLEEPVRATPYTIKQAYRKASIRYHPDKTGRDESDYVFIAVKSAWDTLSDVAKRQAYDSTEMPFDDSIPPDVAAAALTNNGNTSSGLLYTDEDFFETFGPVFERNLRFDTRLQEQTSKKKGAIQIPTLGDWESSIEEVQSFYDYWTHFTSWRDFSQKAQEELFENNNPLEDAESRYEKRFYQKEIDKRAKALKRQEMNRIQTLVQRSMAADPRLQKHYREQKEAKEMAALLRKQKKEWEEEQKRHEEEQRQKEEAVRAELDRQQRAQDKVQREKEKKQLRKAKQVLRKITIAAFQEQGDAGASLPFPTLEDMSDEVEFLCNEYSLLQVQELTEEFIQTSDFDKLRDRVFETRNANEQEREAKRKAAAERQKQLDDDAAKKAEEQAAAKAWSPEELAALAKAVKKFPGGGANRWELIATFINNLCRPEKPKTREECIEQYNKIQSNKLGNNKGTTTNAAATPSAAPVKPAAVPETTTESNEKNTTTIEPTPLVNGFKAAANGEQVNGDNNHNHINPKTMPAKSESIMTDYSTASTDADSWSDEQGKQLLDALAKHPATMDKNERWACIAKMVTGKTKKQCVQRFKEIRDAIKSKK